MIEIIPWPRAWRPTAAQRHGRRSMAAQWQAMECEGKCYIHAPTGLIRRPRQGHCLEHFHSICLPRPPGASPPYIARHQKLRVPLVGRFDLVGVFSGFLVCWVSGFLVSRSSSNSGLSKTMTGASSWAQAHFVVSKVKVT